MANKKLTLSLDEELIEGGKQYARSLGLSLSSLIEKYLAEKLARTGYDQYDIQPSPTILNIGISFDTVATDEDKMKDRMDYYDYLTEKHTP